MAGALAMPITLPTTQDTLKDWWPAAVAALPNAIRQTANSLVMHVLRGVWLERNSRVFDNRAEIGRASCRERVYVLV